MTQFCFVIPFLFQKLQRDYFFSTQQPMYKFEERRATEEEKKIQIGSNRFYKDLFEGLTIGNLGGLPNVWSENQREPGLYKRRIRNSSPNRMFSVGYFAFWFIQWRFDLARINCGGKKKQSLSKNVCSKLWKRHTNRWTMKLLIWFEKDSDTKEIKTFTNTDWRWINSYVMIPTLRGLCLWILMRNLKFVCYSYSIASIFDEMTVRLILYKKRLVYSKNIKNTTWMSSHRWGTN